MSDITVLVFGYLVQTVLMVYVGLVLFNIQLSRTKLAVCGVLLALCVWIVRGIYSLLGIPLGTHTLVLTLLFILVLKNIGGQTLSIATGATLASMMLVLIGDVVSQLFVVPILGLTTQQIFGNPWLHILLVLVENSFLIIVLIINKIFGFTILNFLDAE